MTIFLDKSGFYKHTFRSEGSLGQVFIKDKRDGIQTVCFALKENWVCIGIFTNNCLEITFFMSNFIFRQVVLVPSAL